MSQKKVIIFLVILSFVKSLGYIFSDIALKQISVLQLQGIHFFVTALLMWIFFFKRVIKVDKRTVIRGAVMGVLFFLGITFQTVGLETTTVSKSSFLTVLDVAFISIISYFLFKQKITRDYIIGVVIMFVGFFLLLFKIDFFHLSSSLVHLQNEANFVIGDFYTIICALIFAIHMVLAGHSVKRYDAFSLVTVQMTVCTLLNFAVSLFQKDSVFKLAGQINIVYVAIIVAVIMGIVGLFTYAGQMYLQRFALPSTVAIILSTESMFATIIAIIMGLEQMTIGVIIGGILVTIGIIITQLGFKRLKPVKSP